MRENTAGSPGELLENRGGKVMKEYNANGYIIRIAENALIQMCLNGLEAYSIAHKKGKRFQKHLETLGLLWGQELELSNNKTLYCL